MPWGLNVDELAGLTDLDAKARAKRVGELLTRHQDIVSELSRIRREALNELIDAGVTRKELAEELGMTRARVGQLLSSGPQPERALLGTGTLTVAIGQKKEGPKRSTVTTPVLSAPMAAACDLITKTAADYGLDVIKDPIPPDNGDRLRLNRPNLIVMGSPRVLRLMEQVLHADRNLGFGEEDNLWYLTERGSIYRSPSDDDEPVDYAYIGRLPRTDGRGTFLYMAGIHAMGTLGAATYITSNLEELYAQVKMRRWSALIECHYDSDHNITAVDRLTEIYFD